MTIAKSSLTSFISTVCISSVRAFSASSGSSSLRNRIKNPELLLQNLNGDSSSWKRAKPQFIWDKGDNSDETTYPIYDPADPQTELARLPIMSVDETRTAIDQAAQAWPLWRDGTTAMQRANLLRQWSQVMAENAEDLALIMTMESGKPLKEARGEVAYARSFLE